MKKRFAALAAALLLTAGLCACGADAPAVKTADPAASAPATGAETLGVPETADFGDAEFHIFSAGNVAYADFTADETASTPLDSAQYRRKALVGQNYKVRISETVGKAYSSGGGPGYKRLSTDANAGDCNFDLALIAGYDVSVRYSVLSTPQGSGAAPSVRTAPLPSRCTTRPRWMRWTGIFPSSMIRSMPLPISAKRSIRSSCGRRIGDSFG